MLVQGLCQHHLHGQEPYFFYLFCNSKIYLSNITKARVSAVFLNISAWAQSWIHILTLYSSSKNMKVILSELHFRCNIVFIVFFVAVVFFANKNGSKQKQSRPFVHFKATMFCSWMNRFWSESYELSIH